MTKDLTKAWQLFDDGAATAKENCFTALVGLMDGIREDLAGKRLYPDHTPLDEFRLICDAAAGGISVEPMAPFLSSLASKKTLLRTCLDKFSRQMETISRYIASISLLCDVLPNDNRETNLNVVMDDEDPDSFLLQAMSPLYNKCANVTGKCSDLLKSGFVLSR